MTEAKLWLNNMGGGDMAFRFDKKLVFMFLFIFLLLLSQSIHLYIEDLNSSVGYEKFVIGLKESLSAERGFSIRQVNELNRIISPEMATYYSLNDSVASLGMESKQVKVYGVSENYNEFNRVQLMEGSFINANDNRQKKNVAVIEDSVAESLFKSKDIMGLEVELYNKRFTIIGVLSTDRAVIEKPLDIGKPRIYIPLDTMDDLIPNAYIGNVEYKDSEGKLDVYSIMDKIALTGKRADDFVIEDLNIVGTQQRQKYDILFFLLGAYCLYLLIRIIVDIVKYIISYSRNSLKEHYFFAMIKSGGKLYLKVLLIILGIMILGVFIWNRITFNIYMDLDKIPDNPASITQVLGMLIKYITDFINYNYINPIYTIQTSKFLQRVNTIAFLIGLIFEILCLSFMKRKKTNKIEGDISFLFNMGIYFIVSTILSVVIIYFVGLSVRILMADILIIWISFIIVSFYHQEEYLRLFFGKSEEITVQG